MWKQFSAAALLSAVACAQSSNSSSSLPIIDLAYQRHQASSFNETGRFYNFSNIRYAAPPLGNLRFAPPTAPTGNASRLDVGDTARICPQASPAWGLVSGAAIAALLTGTQYNNTGPYTPPVITEDTPIAPQDPRTSEDCLFLDVFVPEDVLNATTTTTQQQGYGESTGGAPVLVWIYGGGYTNGDKYNNPAGLIARSGNVTDGNVIYVAMNYRLGAFGFMSGPTYEEDGGVANLGLLDQRFALEWVQENIHLFGGDPNRVTVIGESAGGGSIMHQMTAYGGTKPVPFQQAIPQSPGWSPVTSQSQQENVFQRFLEIANTTSLAGLRELPTEDIIRANYLHILEAPFGSYRYGPVVDGDFAPLLPGQLLARGRSAKDVRVMVGHNSNEGLYFTDPAINSTQLLLSQLRGTFPGLSASNAKYLTETLYPSPSNSTPYTNDYQRGAAIVAEAIFTCNTKYLSTAYGNETYSYLFAVPPGLHGLDVRYTYFEGGALDSTPLGVRNRTVALALQDFITSFTIEGRPSAAEGITEFRMYGEDARVLELNATTIAETRDSNANARCDWWQKALYS